MENNQKEVNNRRTFAIISHPDAGKTTLTEQLLLQSGLIREAGTVKGRGSNKNASSDWMEIEKQRGISVTSSVLQFEFDGKNINILDTPGHEDFSEDTYRTLMAVDSVVMVIDSARGIQAQTKKLFEIVSKRHIPIFTFFNKIDRDSLPALDLVDELENVLGIKSFPMNWPIGSGQVLQGIYSMQENELIPYKNAVKNQLLIDETMDEIELVKDAGNEFDIQKIQAGELTPVFFGSALGNFGVKEFLSSFLEYSSAPREQKDINGDVVTPNDNQFSGFVFKIQANMDPKHRDRVAFFRIVSGKFEHGMDVTIARSNKKIKLSNVTQFVAEERENISQAIAGGIIGVYDTGNFQIGDTIYSGKKEVKFPDLPTFTPELFNRVIPKDVLKKKSFDKGITQLVQEGTIQLFKPWRVGDNIIGAVGQLQFEVFQFRMKNEYNVDIRFDPIGNKIARWISPNQLDESMSSSRNILVKDKYDEPVFLFENAFSLNWFSEKYPDVVLEQKM